MNTQIQEHIIKLLASANENTQKGVDFLAAQMPDVCSQYLNWYFWTSAFWVVVGVMALTACGFIIRRAYKLAEKNQTRYKDGTICDDGWNDYNGALALLATIVGVIFGLVLCFNLIDMLHVWIAPKVVLADYLKTLLK